MTDARDNPKQSRSRTKELVIAAVIIGVLFLLSLILLVRPDDEPDESAGSAQSSASSSSPTRPEPVCRTEGRYAAGFMSPQADDQQTQEMLQTMNTDAVTFGGWIRPVSSDDYPDKVQDEIGDREAYQYSIDMSWRGTEQTSSDTLVQVDGTEYGIIEAGEDSVVVTESTDGDDSFHSLLRASAANGNSAYIGLPVPEMRTTEESWLPDSSYRDVVDGFNEKFVRAYHDRGADGFYLAMEMPMTDASHWDPITNYYDRQTEIINNISDGTTVLISPYLEGREDRATISPETAAGGYEKLLDLANGTRILVSPQDGLGVGTTALESDDSEAHTYTVDDYFAALEEVEPARLYATIEAMQPGGSSDTREDTSRDRVEDQLTATEPYVQGAIGFQWAGDNSMTEVPHIGWGACAAGPNELG